MPRFSNGALGRELRSCIDLSSIARRPEAWHSPYSFKSRRSGMLGNPLLPALGSFEDSVERDSEDFL